MRAGLKWREEKGICGQRELLWQRRFLNHDRMRAGGQAFCGRCPGLIRCQFPHAVNHEGNSLQARLIRLTEAILIEIVERDAGQFRPIRLHAEFDMTEVALCQRQQHGRLGGQAEALWQRMLIKRDDLFARLDIRKKGAAFLIALLLQQIAH